MYSRIFGKTYKFNGDSRIENLLREILVLYEAPSQINDADVEVNFVKELPNISNYSQNPALHKYSSKQIQMKLGSTWVSWVNHPLGNKCLVIYVALPKFNCLKDNVMFWRSWRSMEFSNELEKFVQLLHELILVPSTYYFDDIVPLHAAAISTKSRCLLLAGTGGVGKSSGLLSIHEELGVSFMADDITVIDNQGGIYGNMAWPKIYGYNCEGNQIRSKILNERGLIDKVHFLIRNRINPSSVRRKIRPDKLFKSSESGRKSLTTLVYLFRQDVDKVSIETIEPYKAATLSCSVLEAEYSVFHNQIHWAEYNAEMQSEVSPLQMKNIRKKWLDIYQSTFSRAKCVKIVIPLRYTHKEYQQLIKNYILLELV